MAKPTIEDIFVTIKSQATEEEVAQVFLLHIKRFWSVEQKEAFCARVFDQHPDSFKGMFDALTEFVKSQNGG